MTGIIERKQGLLSRRAAIGLLAGVPLVACKETAGNALAPVVARGPDVVLQVVNAAALRAADFRAAMSNSRLRLPAGRYVLDSMRLSAPVVAFDPGAVIVPVDGDATIAFDGRIEDGLEQVFAVKERLPGKPPGIVLAQQSVRPEWWGAKAAGKPHLGHDDSLAWQQAIDALGGEGGTVAGRRGVTYPLRYPIVVVGKSISVNLRGATLLTDLARRNRAPSCVLLVGDSREWNLGRIRERRRAGDLFNNFENPNYVDIGMLNGNFAARRFPNAADPGRNGFTARKCTVGRGRVEYYDDVFFPGNYGVQFSNAADCVAVEIEMRNTGQGFGFGSDMAPRVPYAVNCRVTGLTVEVVNQAHTYYGAGFHGYARDCVDQRVVVLKGAPDGSPDGNLWATNVAYNCSSTGSGGQCGRGTNGEGFAIGADSRRCMVTNAQVIDAKRAFVNFGPLNIAAADGSVIADSTARDVDDLISLQSRNMRLERVRGNDVKGADVRADNVNATGNVLIGCDVNRIATGSVPMAQVLSANKFLKG